MTLDLLHRLLEPGALQTYLQPIIDFQSGEDPRVHAVECLTRGPAGTNLHRADVLFEYVRRKGAEAAVDRACIRGALAALSPRRDVPEIAVNVHASTLSNDACFPAFLLGLCDDAGIDPARLVLEITEHTGGTAEGRFLPSIRLMRAFGVRFAVDDVGTGLSNFRMILDVAPDLVKIDRYLVAGCSADPRRAAVLDSLHALAGRIGGMVVVEGIENASDFAKVLGSGITLVQGYLLAEPVPVAEYDAGRVCAGARRLLPTGSPS